MKAYLSYLFGVLTLSGLVSCDLDDDSSRLNYYFDFNNTATENWQVFFSDYPVGEEEFYELDFEYVALPDPLDTSIRGLKISGNNHSDDLFSAIYRKFDGLPPNTTFYVYFDVDLASNAPTDAVGIGGSPDLSIGAGGIGYAPASSVDIENLYRPNFESRLQSGLSNEVFQVLGTIGVSDTFPTPFMLINRNNFNTPIELTSNSAGELYLMIATDSGFEGITTLYYRSIEVWLDPRS